MTNNDPVDPIIFRESQRFTQPWVWLVVLLPAAMAWYGALEQLVYGRPYGTNPVSDQGMVIILIAFGILLPLFILSIRFVVVVRNSGIYVKFFPIHLSFRHYPFEDIYAYDAVTYRPLRDYGGWGIRYGSHGKAYNIKGNRGLMLKFTNGKHLLLGSQESDVLKMSVDQARNRKSN
ncbi:DUF6141 family protein [Methanolobus sp. WCC4]|uniref:DUF6141 family protein n=1 Tax=Methanolobus sp. WCC4 TaxID=3125784 RepID=UPI0030F5CDDA